MNSRIRAALAAVACLLLLTPPARAQDAGEVLYRARTDVDGQPIGVEIHIIDPGGISQWAAYATTVSPDLANQLQWQQRDCSETDIEVLLEGAEHATRGDLVLGHVTCNQDSARYWSLPLVQGSMPGDWTAAQAFHPAQSGQAAATGNIHRLEGGMAIWVRSAAVLAGFATIAATVAGVMLIMRVRKLEKRLESQDQSRTPRHDQSPSPVGGKDKGDGERNRAERASQPGASDKNRRAEKDEDEHNGKPRGGARKTSTKGRQGKAGQKRSGPKGGRKK